MRTSAFSPQLRQLLRADSMHRSTGGEFARVIPPAAAIVNLFGCASFEHLLRDDPQGHFCALFFLAESAILIALCLSSFVSGTFPLLVQTRVLPNPRADRFLFALAAEMRRGIVLALVGSTVFFLMFVYHHSAALACAAAGSYLLCVAAVETAAIALALVASHSTYPAAMGIALGGMALLGLTIGLLSPDMTAFLASCPPSRWAAASVMAVSAGNGWSFLANECLVAATAGIAVMVGRRAG